MTDLPKMIPERHTQSYKHIAQYNTTAQTQYCIMKVAKRLEGTDKKIKENVFASNTK